MGPAIIDVEKNKAGMLYGAFSFMLWGVLPLYLYYPSNGSYYKQYRHLKYSITAYYGLLL